MKAPLKYTLPTGVVIADFIELPRDILEKRGTERNYIHRMLSDHMNDRSLIIRHTANGQPYIENHPKMHISISHSNGWCTLYISDKKAVGIDIQTHTSMLIQGYDFFVNEEEKRVFKDTFTSEQLYLIWCAKEAFYKMVGGNIANLRKEVTIYKIQCEIQGQVLLRFDGKEYTLLFFQDEEKTLVVTT